MAMNRGGDNFNRVDVSDQLLVFAERRKYLLKEKGICQKEKGDEGWNSFAYSASTLYSLQWLLWPGVYYHQLQFNYGNKKSGNILSFHSQIPCFDILT